MSKGELKKLNKIYELKIYETNEGYHINSKGFGARLGDINDIRARSVEYELKMLNLAISDVSKKLIKALYEKEDIGDEK